MEDQHVARILVGQVHQLAQPRQIAVGKLDDYQSSIGIVRRTPMRVFEDTAGRRIRFHAPPGVGYPVPADGGRLVSLLSSGSPAAATLRDRWKAIDDAAQNHFELASTPLLPADGEELHAEHRARVLGLEALLVGVRLQRHRLGLGKAPLEQHAQGAGSPY